MSDGQNLRIGKENHKQLEYGPGTIYAGFRSSPGFGVRGQSYSNFLASSVGAADLKKKRGPHAFTWWFIPEDWNGM